MAAMATGAAALTSLRSLYEIAKDIRNANDADKLRMAAAQMFDLALAAREQVAILEEERNSAVVELAALKASVENAKAFDEEIKNYTRQRNYTGAFVYREKPIPGSDAPSPHYCANCFGKKKLSVLQPEKGSHAHLTVQIYACPECDTVMPLRGSDSP
jgi:hypothetical protein